MPANLLYPLSQGFVLGLTALARVVLGVVASFEDVIFADAFAKDFFAVLLGSLETADLARVVFPRVDSSPSDFPRADLALAGFFELTGAESSDGASELVVRSTPKMSERSASAKRFPVAVAELVRASAVSTVRLATSSSWFTPRK